MLYETAYRLRNVFDQFKIFANVEVEFPEIIINRGPGRITITTDAETGYYFVHAYENNRNVKVYELNNSITLLAVIFRLLDFRQ